jgi:glycosyltransferase involved in cell wall biosynthesis
MRNKKKILFTMPGKVAGGGHLGTLEIMDRSRHYGFESIAAVNQINTAITSLLDHYDIPFIFIPGYPGPVLKNSASLLTQIYLFRKAIIREKISIIHLSDLITGHYGILAARLAGIPSIMHMKSLYWLKEYGWPNRLVISQADLIIAISDAVHKACLQARLPARKIITVHDAVEPESFPEKSKTEAEVKKTLGIAQTKIVIGFVGRLGVEWKNEPLVYNLAGQLGKQIKDLVLLVVGGPFDGEEDTFNKSKELAKKLGGDTEVIFMGERRDIPQILPAMDVYLVPSREEPFGRVVIEGMAAGLPVVGSNNGGIPEMITDGHDGFLCAPDDLPGWIAIVKTLIEDRELRKRIGIEAMKTVEKRFRLEDMINKIVKEYCKLIEI